MGTLRYPIFTLNGLGFDPERAQEIAEELSRCEGGEDLELILADLLR